MKKALFVVLICILISLSISLGRSMENKKRSLCLDDIVSIMNDDEDIVIKEGVNVKYSGKVCNLNPEYKIYDVVEIASCDDSEFTTTIFIK